MRPHVIAGPALMVTLAACGSVFRVEPPSIPPGPKAPPAAMEPALIPPGPTVTPPVMHSPAVEATPLDERASRIARLEGDLAAAKAEQVAAQQQAAREREAATLAPLVTAATWASWLGLLLSVLGAGVAVALRVLAVPVGPMLAGAVASGGVTLLLIGRAVAALLIAPWWPMAVLGLVLLGAGVGLVVVARRWLAAHHAAWDTARDAVATLRAHSSVDAAMVDAQSITAQVGHVRTLNDKVLHGTK